jgi:hypothetical protein
VRRAADTEAEARAGVESHPPNCARGPAAVLKSLTCRENKGYDKIDYHGHRVPGTALVIQDCIGVYVCEQGRMDCGPNKPSAGSRQ